MNLPKLLAKHLRDVHFGGNWTTVNLHDVLKDVTWQQATTPVNGCNTIVALVYHIHYYIQAVTPVFSGHSLRASDAESFAHPPVTSAAEWTALLERTWKQARTLADAIEQLPEEQLGHTFEKEQYGTWYRNIQGIIEHTHYHLGQIVILKKFV